MHMHEVISINQELACWQQVHPDLKSSAIQNETPWLQESKEPINSSNVNQCMHPNGQEVRMVFL